MNWFYTVIYIKYLIDAFLPMGHIREKTLGQPSVFFRYHVGLDTILLVITC
ncbi:hypothetical protein OKW24_004454 [Peribacillus simplex]|uniref:hypothetical protein n=1 Tax=Peribacillus simplex TaxID=1478 RepID=UPI0024E1D83B|nr:hypothetical protein [Peribacillus simplex]MDF9762681.1 hypothetical protein [Peribacillus simplex]